MLSKLIEGLQIFLKYGDVSYPTHCEHDVMTICVDPAKVSAEDKAKLDKLGFFVDEAEDCFKSYIYGSA